MQSISAAANCAILNCFINGMIFIIIIHKYYKL
jgi:hypothetical protein